MFTTSLDILYLVLSIGLGLVLLLLAILIYQFVHFMMRLNRITDKVDETVDTFNTYMRLPATILIRLIEWWKKNK